MNNVDQVTTLHLRNEAQFLTFCLEPEGDLYAINIFKVKEIINYKEKITVYEEDSSSYIEGIITVRELNIPVVDLKKWFFYREGLNLNLKEEGIDSDDYFVMVCDFSGILVGIRIHGAERILQKKWEDIIRNDDDKNPSNKTIGYTRFYDNRIVQIVDVEKMVVEAFSWIEEDKDEELRFVSKINSHKHILCADDSKPVQKMMEKILTELGLKFFMFNNGKDLLDFLFSNESPDMVGAVITDLEMPITSGFEVIKAVKTDDQYKHIPVIVNSSMSGTSNENMAKSLNADGFISKSNPREVEEMLKKFLT